MADKLGDVYYVAHIRGDNLNKEAKAAGDQAGEQMGEATRKSFDTEMSKLARDLETKFEKEGKLGATKFADALERQLKSRRDGITEELAGIFSDRESFQRFIKDSDSVGEGLDRLSDKLKKAKEYGGLTNDEFKSLSFSMQNWGKSLKVAEDQERSYARSLEDLRLELDKVGANHSRVTEAWEKAEVNRTRAIAEGKLAIREQLYDWEQLESTMQKVTVETDKSTKAVDRHNRSMERQGSLWSRIPHNGRQALLIIGAITGGFEQIATLGSAAGAGIVLFGTAVLTAIPALGVFIGGIASLVKTMSDEDAKMPGYVANIRAFGEAFVVIGKDIETNLFGNLDASLGRFVNDTLPQLTGAISALAGSIGTTLATALDRLGDPKPVENFNTILGMSGKLFEGLTAAAVSLTGALAGITVAAGPSLERFSAWLVTVTDQFDKWANSPVGQGQLEQWFKDGSDILSGFVDLLVTTSKMLARLVTPESVDRTLQFMESLEGAMTFVEAIAEIFAELDIFGIAAQILDVLGNALVPFLNLLEPIATVLNDVITVGINNLSLALTLLAPLFAPIQVAFDLWAIVIERVTAYLTPLQEQLTAAGTPLTEIADRITLALIPALDSLLDAFFELLPSPEEMARIIREDVVPAIQKFADWIVNEAVPAIKTFWEWIELQVIPRLKILKDGLDNGAKAWKDWANGIIGYVKPLADFLSGLFGLMKDILGIQGKIKTPAGVGRPGLSDFAPTATGGTFYHSQVRRIAEAGAEMVVPLQRPLSQVDPSVRAVAEYARGDSSVSSSGKSIVIETGAFQVRTNVADPVLVASMVMDEIVETALN